jgi:hypothetical protein
VQALHIGGRVAAAAVSAETAAGETTWLEADMVKELKEDEGLLSKERLRGRLFFNKQKLHFYKKEIRF